MCGAGELYVRSVSCLLIGGADCWKEQLRSERFVESDALNESVEHAARAGKGAQACTTEYLFLCDEFLDWSKRPPGASRYGLAMRFPLNYTFGWERPRRTSRSFGQPVIAGSRSVS